MSSQPNRILAAIMFTDMVGYTALMQVNETLARRKRKRHREVLAEFHAKYKGRIIQYFGDGTLSIFRSSVEAVQCAIEIQKQLRAPIEVPLRIGIHTGDIIIEKDNIIGDAVNVASRIESFSVPGAVMISDVVYEQVKNQPQFELQFLGQFQFKNVERPFGIYFLSNDGLIIPLAANLEGKGQRIQASKNYLPKVFTSFLGREKEIAELKGLISNNRLVTLTGPGGMGKTRLSIQVAREMENQFPDGVYWVPLASVTDPDTTTFVIAKNLDLKEDPVLSIEEVLTHFFHDSRALLVLDNFEQILRATDVIEKLLQFCDSLFILVTSRIVLQIAGEVEYPVPPLEVPNLQAYNSLEQLSKTPAVALFAERAEASGRKFQLTQENVEIVAKICLRLDGLPLAIELAAARTKVFKPKALLSRLNKRLDLLKSGGQFPVRHQTLRQTISWSYNLLNNEEQELFRRISVFVGKSTMEAIERVCGQNGLFDSNIADGVMALVDNSLLQTEETPDDLRFYMLETIREFAIEALEKSNTAVVLKKAHIQYFIQLAESAAPHLSGSEGERWRQVLYQEQGNFRASIGYAIALKDIALAYRVALALRMFWTSNGMVKEGIQQLEKLLAIPISKTLYPEKLKISQALGINYLMVPMIEKAIPLLEESYQYWRNQGNQRQLGLALNDLSWGYLWKGCWNKSETYALEAKLIFEQLSDEARLVASLNNLGCVQMFRAIPNEAIPYFEKNLELTKRLKDQRRYVYSLISIGESNYIKGLYELAESQIQEAIVVCRNNSYLFEAYGLATLGFIYYAKGDFEACTKISWETEKLGRAAYINFAVLGALVHRVLAAFGKGDLENAKLWSDKAKPFADKLVSTRWAVRHNNIRAKIAMRLGEIELAKTCCRKMIENEIEEGGFTGFIPGLEIAARLAALKGKYDMAAQLYFNARILRKTLGTPIIKSEAYIYHTFLSDLKNNLSEEKINLAETRRVNDSQLLKLVHHVLHLF